jgi:hypothetical protein
MSTKNEARVQLEQSLTKRVPTWVVANAIMNLGVLPEGSLRQSVAKLAREASWNNQMPDDFDRVNDAASQLATFAELFPEIAVPSADADVYSVLYTLRLRNAVVAALRELGINEDTAEEALVNRHALAWENGLATSKKSFVKRLRFLASFEGKIARIENVLEIRHAQMQAKSRLAYKVDVTKTDDLSLAYIAYVAARANRRSVFLLGSQSKAFDNIVDGLFGLLGENSSWDQIALVSPVKSVFKRLDAETLGNLIGVFHREMVVAANGLARLYPELPTWMRKEMVMVQGVDSSTWNAYAGAFNTMRSAWIAATITAGLDNVFDAYLPGKAARLMAADLVWWGRNAGKELHEDTRMFNALPQPWEVVSGTVKLTRQGILAAAEAENVVDAVKSGWVSPRTELELEVATAEPATVHGVIVSNPDLALFLRKAGAFSSKQHKDVEAFRKLPFERENVTVGEKTYSVVGLAK